MGSSQLSSEPSTCTSSSLPQPSLLLSTKRRSFLLSHLPMSMVSPMTTPKLTSRRRKLRMLREKFQDLSQSLFPMAESRPPHTQPTTITDLLLRSPMKVPLSTHQSLKKDTDMLPQCTNQHQLTMLRPFMNPILLFIE